MALQQLVCCFTVVIIFFCKACDSQQPACGSRSVNSSSSNITGGHDAAAGSWPWFAHIKVDGGPPLFDSGSGFVPTSFGFGGSLINNQWVLTAASTMSLGFSSVVVYLGRNSRSGPNPNEVNRTVVNITCHPGFSSSTHENDICLLKLSAPVNFTDYIQPTCLASQNSTFNSETGSWAISFNVFGGVSNNLQEVNIPIVGNSVCRASRPGVTDSIICTGEMDPCLVSLGAPLMTQSGSIWLQSGVLIAAGCFGLPAVYTPVSQYQKWIRDTVTGTPPGFVTYPSPPSSTAPPTTPPAPPTDPSTTPPAPPTDPSTTPPAPPTDPSTTPPAPPTDPSTTPPVPPTDPSTTPPVPPTDPSTTPPAPPTDPSTTPPAPPTTSTPPPTSPTCVGVFCSGENLIHFTHFTSLCVLVVLLHVFAATVGN